jgi:hypothetical protein
MQQRGNMYSPNQVEQSNPNANFPGQAIQRSNTIIQNNAAANESQEISNVMSLQSQN